MQTAADESSVLLNFYDFDLETTDFKTILLKMQKDGVDSIIIAGYEDHSIVFFTQKQELGFDVPVFTGTAKADSFTDKVIENSPKGSLEGTVTYDQSVSPAFKKRIISRFPDITDQEIFSAAYGYDEVMYLYRAMSSCKDKEASCVVSSIVNDKAYNPSVESSGFGEDRIIRLSPSYYIYFGGILKPIVINP